MPGRPMTRTGTIEVRKRTTSTKQYTSNSSNSVEEVTPQIPCVCFKQRLLKHKLVIFPLNFTRTHCDYVFITQGQNFHVTVEAHRKTV